MCEVFFATNLFLWAAETILPNKNDCEYLYIPIYYTFQCYVSKFIIVVLE